MSSDRLLRHLGAGRRVDPRRGQLGARGEAREGAPERAEDHQRRSRRAQDARARRGLTASSRPIAVERARVRGPSCRLEPMCRGFAVGRQPSTWRTTTRTDLEGLDRPAAADPPSPGHVAVTRRRMWPSERPVKTTSADRGRASTGAPRAGLGDERLTVRSRVSATAGASQDRSVTRRCERTDRSRLGTGARFLLRRSPTLRA